MGEQLGRLGEALRLSEMAAKYLPPGCLSDQLNAISKLHAAAKKDNDFIVSCYPHAYTLIVKISTVYCVHSSTENMF